MSASTSTHETSEAKLNGFIDGAIPVDSSGQAGE